MRTIHVTPDFDLYPHYLNRRCSCNPKQIHDHLIIHKSFDERELFEVPYSELNLLKKARRLWLTITDLQPEPNTWTNWITEDP